MMIGLLFFSSCSERRNTEEHKQDASAISSTQDIKKIVLNTKVLVQKEKLNGESLDIAAMTQVEKNKSVIGVWQVFFPSPNDNWGYRFNDAFEFRYVDHSEKAKKQRYGYTKGKWRLNGDTLEIQVKEYYLQDRDAEDGPLGLQFPPESKLVSYKVNDNDWYIIGHLDSIRVGIVANGENYPVRITLHPLLIDNVQQEDQFYYLY